MKIRLPSFNFLIKIICLSSMICIISGCSVHPSAPTQVSSKETTPTISPSASSIPTVVEGAESLSNDEIATLNSLKKVDDHPLYTMQYFGAYGQSSATRSPNLLMYKTEGRNPQSWACSLFAAFGDTENQLFGRNFDFEFSPALLLFTNPPDGYASVSMVDIAYLGFGETNAGTILELPLRD
ncbi:MAG: hypothetical protein JSV37_02265, partial [Anaerolineaceae bacterium]